jgi:S1-C subfamily serine protease
MTPDESPWRSPLPEHDPRPAAPWRQRVVVVALVGMLLLGALGGGAAGAILTHTLLPPPAPVVVTQSAPAVAQLQPVALAQANATDIVIDVFKKLSPAVVKVGVRGATPGRNGGPGTGTGSGFIIDKDVQIITNNHVVQGATTLAVTLADGTELPARVVGTAPGHDIALIKVDPPASGLTVARLGDSDAVVPGELAIAIGTPLGLEQTVTSGIISSTGRSFSGGSNRAALRGLIQTDAAINPGNSGGPLLNGQGEVVGINTLRPPDTYGIGFAVPINTVKRLLPQLQAGGRVSAPYLGISGQTITPQLATSLSLPVKEGVLVARVVEGGPAATAGLKGGDQTGAGGDIITALDGKPIRRFEDIGVVLDTHRAGETVAATILRNGQSQTVNIVLGEWPDQ